MRALVVAVPLLLLPLPAAAQRAAAPEPAEGIEVSGILVEEAYLQEEGVVQTVARGLRARGGRWEATLTHEHPAFGGRHQVEVEVTGREGEALAGAGLGWRVLAWGGEAEGALTVSPGVEVEWTRGEAGAEDGWEASLLLPASVRLGETLTANTALAVSRGLGEDGETGWSVGEGLFWRAHPRVNLVLEGVYGRGGSPFGEGEDGDHFALSPGVQVALPLGEGAVLVPGGAVAFGAGPSEGARAVVLYLSIEHAWGRR